MRSFFYFLKIILIRLMKYYNKNIENSKKVYIIILYSSIYIIKININIIIYIILALLIIIINESRTSN